MRVAAVALAVLSVLSSGCFFLGGGDARDESSAWTEPGLFDQLAAAPDGYSVKEERSPIAIPLSDPEVATAWHDPAVTAVSDGEFMLGTGRRGDRGSYDLILGRSPYARGAEWRDDEAFLAFARKVLVLDAEGERDLAERYAASFTPDGESTRHYGEGVVPVKGPFTLDGVTDDLGPPVAAPDSSNLLWREGGGWNVTYLAPLRVLRDGGYELEVGPGDLARFRHEGTSNVDDAGMDQRLERFMADLGRTAPDVTFSHQHGD